MNDKILETIKRALAEDIPTIDVSSQYLFTDERSSGSFFAKEAGVISGMDVCEATFKLIDAETEFKILKHNGERVEKGDVLALVQGRTKSLLMAERVALNFLQRMSGIATMTANFVAETKGTTAKILDTRKTTPLLRDLEKQAVVDGGGTNHRMNLSTMVMLKDNHLKAAKSLIIAVDTVRKHVGRDMLIEVEVEELNAFQEALESDADVIMLDNMNLELMRECVRMNQGKKLLEASGNMTLDRIASVAQTGVDMISVGALTHSYKSMDISLKF